MENSKVVINGSPILLYEEIKAGIKELIKTNHLSVGDKLPNETELCEHFNVSRITIRRSIKELVEEEVIEIIRGKGTFVKAHKKSLQLLNLKGFTEGLSSEDENIQKIILSKKIIHNNGEIAKNFAFKYQEFVELIRVVSDDEGPLSFDYAYLPLELYPDIDTVITDKSSTFQLIRDKYHIYFTKVKKEIEYVQPSTEICKHLEIKKTSPVICVKKVIFGNDQSPVHYSKYYLIGERVKFFIETDYAE